MSLTAEELSAMIRDAAQEVERESQSKGKVQPIQPPEQHSATVKQKVEFFTELAALMEKGIALIPDLKAINYFNSIRIYSIKEIRRIENELDLVDKL